MKSGVDYPARETVSLHPRKSQSRKRKVDKASGFVWTTTTVSAASNNLTNRCQNFTHMVPLNAENFKKNKFLWRGRQWPQRFEQTRHFPPSGLDLVPPVPTRPRGTYSNLKNSLLAVYQSMNVKEWNQSPLMGGLWGSLHHKHITVCVCVYICVCVRVSKCVECSRSVKLH